MSDEPLAREREPIARCGRALRPWLGRTLLPAAVLDPSGQASPAEGQPCRTGAASFMVGKSTGPRTPEGLERSRRANWKHGCYSREAKAERSALRAAILALRDLRMLGH